ncbi:HAMP domain-containing sensor histidine kinase [Sulfurimonas sp. HSL-1716]|uniref:sensor histidine kinase n=1 Tax=Hydrocurvibacter sulfurireducens TaxID=3131937 RepID=UPI0031F8E709
MITSEELQHLIEQTYKIENDFKDLKDSYNHLQNTIEKVVEFLPNAIWILENDGKVFLQNSQAKELSELLVILRLDTNDYEINFKDRSYLVKISNYQDKFLVSATDITEQKRKENLATMGQMAAHLSHEIRNPIGSISLLTSTLKKRVKPENIAIVSEIEKSIFRIERIIKATLMFSKGVQADKKLLKWSQLQDALKEIIGYYSYSKEIRFGFIEDDFTINGDADLLLMMFSNFIINAIDAIELDDEEEGEIELSYKNDGEFHSFYIYDSGVPIENKRTLFEAFKSTKVKGNGLGLILAKQIATAHDGDVFLIEGEKKLFEIKIKV